MNKMSPLVDADLLNKARAYADLQSREYRPLPAWITYAVLLTCILPILGISERLLWQFFLGFNSTLGDGYRATYSWALIIITNIVALIGAKIAADLLAAWKRGSR